MIWRNIFLMRVNFSFIHTAHRVHAQIGRKQWWMNNCMILSYRQVDFQILKCFHMWKQVSFFNVLKVTNSYQTLFMSFSNGNQRWYVISIQTTVLKSPFLSLVLNKMIKEVKCKYFFLTQVTQFHWRAKSFKKLCSIYPHKDYRR